MSEEQDIFSRRGIVFTESEDGSRGAAEVIAHRTKDGLCRSETVLERPLPLAKEEAEAWVNEVVSYMTDEERQFYVKCLCGEDWPENY